MVGLYLMPATTYSPTHFRVQYNRPCATILPMSGTIQDIPSTPILDLEIPLPVRRSRAGSQALGFLFGFASTLAFFAGFQKSMPFPYLVLVFVSTLLLAVTVHELGHLLAGWSVGFHFNSIQVAWFSLSLEHGKLALRASREVPLAGYASIHIDHVRRLRKRLMFFVAAGPAASICSVIAIAVLVNALDLHRSWIATPAAAFVFISLVLGLVSLVPIGGRGHWTDGARLGALLSSREKARRWFCISALANAYRNGKTPKMWSSSWTKAAASIRDGSIDELSSCWLAYASASDRKRVDLAAGYLERCLALAGIVGATMRDLLALEAAVFQAWDRGNADKAAKWLEHLTPSKRLPPLSRLRATIALECAKGNFESASGHWAEGQSLIEKLPATQVRDLMASSWAEWRGEIRERQEKSNAAVEQG